MRLNTRRNCWSDGVAGYSDAGSEVEMLLVEQRERYFAELKKFLEAQ